MMLTLSDHWHITLGNDYSKQKLFGECKCKMGGDHALESFNYDIYTGRNDCG